MLTETLAGDTRANKIAGQICPLVDSAAASRVKWVEIGIFFPSNVSTNGTCAKKKNHVYPNMLLQPSMFMHLEEASADESHQCLHVRFCLSRQKRNHGDYGVVYGEWCGCEP